MHLEKSKLMPRVTVLWRTVLIAGLCGQFIAAQDPVSNLPGKTPPKNPSKLLNFFAWGVVPDQVDCSDLHFSHLNPWCWLPLGWGADVISGNWFISPRDADQRPSRTGG
jgi:hypothetical protein